MNDNNKIKGESVYDHYLLLLLIKVISLVYPTLINIKRRQSRNNRKFQKTQRAQIDRHSYYFVAMN